MPSLAGKYNFTIQQGDTWSDVLTFYNDTTLINLDGYSASMMLKTADSVSSAILSMSTATSTTLINGGVNGTLTINVPNTTTSTFSFDNCVYDLKLTSPTGIVTRVLEGSINLSTQTTW